MEKFDHEIHCKVCRKAWLWGLADGKREFTCPDCEADLPPFGLLVLRFKRDLNRLLHDAMDADHDCGTITGDGCGGCDEISKMQTLLEKIR